ncbi:MAG: hypothetical protein H6779_04740 [Candidatus Nomurabacteria bacterium]|nr:hypothetical protein [Candidatus Nomurabacteria bacterium]USN87681.1 MAG: hypothetical protein H6779_04740 [Candidatus Nomurabacteria bacterium]
MEANLFHDISRLPQERGMLFLPISLSRISNAQSAENCFKYLQHLDSKIVKTSGVGVTVLYGDYLYLLTAKESPKDLRSRYLALMTQHRNGLLNILKKDTAWVSDFFTFKTYGQAMIDFSDIFLGYWQKVLETYENDRFLQKCIAFDSGKDFTQEQAHFILEESLFLYLIKKRIVSFENKIINNHEQWVLEAYPGKPLATETYLMQKNIFNLDDEKNRYQNHFYDADENKLYNLKEIDIEKFFNIKK